MGDQSVCKDVTDDFITGPPGSEACLDVSGANDPRPLRDSRQVFVVHGRNEIARKALFDFLRSIDLDPLEWSQAVNAAGQPTPYIGDILDAAFSRAHAVVVLFTPDDEAYLRPQFRNDKDPTHEVGPTGQARPNVLFEAGMAMGRDPRRTVLVELGTVRPFSDIAGRHLIRLDNAPQQRQQLALRLETAGCPVKLDGIDWQTAGDFDAALDLTHSSRITAELDRSQLSAEAMSLLGEAANDHVGTIHKISTAGGLIIRTNGKVFGTTGEPESQAIWEGAIDDLLKRGLVKDKNGKDTIFLVTREGFRSVR